MRSTSSLLIPFLLAACGAHHVVVPRTLVTVAPCPEAAPVVAAAPVAAAAPAAPVADAITTTGDLDLDGTPEEIRLTADGSLRVFRDGRELTDPSGRAAGAVADYEPGFVGTRLEVVDIDRRDGQRELMVVTTSGDEDPPQRYRFLVYRNGRLWNMVRRFCDDDGEVVVPAGVVARLPGDGSVTLDYEHCVRDADPERLTGGITERVRLRYSIGDGWMRHGDLMETQQRARRASGCILAG